MYKIGDRVKVDTEAVNKRIQKWKDDPKIWLEGTMAGELPYYLGKQGIVISDLPDMQQVEFIDGFIGTFFKEELILVS